MADAKKATNPLSQEFADGLQSNLIRYQSCQSCGLNQSLSKLLCKRCGSDSLRWHSAIGKATVQAVTKVWRAPSVEFRELVPYVLVLAKLDEGPVFMAHAAPSVAIRTRVIASFFEHGGRTLIRFLPLDQG